MDYNGEKRNLIALSIADEGKSSKILIAGGYGVFAVEKIKQNAVQEKKMEHLSPFCTCEHISCKLHPANHEKGCAPCIEKNLRLKEMPNCFFNLLEGAKTRTGDSFDDFANLVHKK